MFVNRVESPDGEASEKNRWTNFQLHLTERSTKGTRATTKVVVLVPYDVLLWKPTMIDLKLPNDMGMTPYRLAMNV